MKEADLLRLKRCPYCFGDSGEVMVEFDVAFRKWKHYDGDRNAIMPHHSKDDDVIVFCLECDNEVLEQDIPEVEL